MKDQEFTAKEAAAYLRVRLNVLWKLERRGLIVSHRAPGGYKRYSVKTLRSCLEWIRGGI